MLNNFYLPFNFCVKLYLYITRLEMTYTVDKKIIWLNWDLENHEEGFGGNEDDYMILK